MERLAQFLDTLPVRDWFNRSAPRVRGGEINPESLDAPNAVAELIAEPLLIRRPLMIIDGVPVVGFDAAQLNARFSLGLDDGEENLEGCPRKPEQDRAAR